MAAQVPFARAPGDINAGGYLDFTSRAGIAIYYGSIKSLYGTPEEHYDLSRDGLNHFLNKLNQRAHEYGWHENVLLIEQDYDNIPGPGTYFLESHGAFSLEHIQAVEEYYNATESRTCQNSDMLAKCLLASLTPEAIDRVNAKEEQWTLEIQPQGQDYEVGMQCGVCLLKVILTISQQETRSSMAHVISQLNELQPIMVEKDYNIQAFNDSIKSLIKQLRKSNKEVPENLLMGLFKVYENVPDETFTRFIQRRKENYLDDNIDTTAEALMDQAESKYYELTTIDKSWRNPTEADKKIAALSAEISTLKSRVKKAGKSSSKQTSGNQSGSNQRSKRPEWMVKHIKPQNIKETRTWNNKTYHWCCPQNGGKCPGKWATHTSKECRGSSFVFPKRKAGNQGTKPKTDKDNQSNKKAKTVRFAQQTQLNDEAELELEAALAEAQDNAQANEGHQD